jgi:hypothetical protein
MKILLVLLSIFTFSTVNAQDTDERFGIKGGLNITFFNVDDNGLGTFATSETGFYGGVFMEFPIDDFLAIQPEVLYISVGDFNFLNVPIYAKYEVATDLYLLAGPSVNYFFDFFTNKLKIGADISSSYNITQQLDVHVKFALGIQELAPNGLFIGLGLKL